MRKINYVTEVFIANGKAFFESEDDFLWAMAKLKEDGCGYWTEGDPTSFNAWRRAADSFGYDFSCGVAIFMSNLYRLTYLPATFDTFCEICIREGGEPIVLSKSCGYDGTTFRY